MRRYLLAAGGDVIIVITQVELRALYTAALDGLGADIHAPANLNAKNALIVLAEARAELQRQANPKR